MLTREKLLELLEQHGLSHRADEILSQCKPSIHLSLGYGVDEADIPIGASKMGGSPDVPPDFVWPEWNGIPLTFIAQFRLSDVKPYDVEDLLPERGMLYFFFEDISYCKLPYEEIQKPNDTYKVIFYEDETASLKRLCHPIIETTDLDYPSEINPCPYYACPIKLEHELTLPVNRQDGHDGRQPFVPVEENRRYWDWYRVARGELEKPMHRLLGHETDIQFNYVTMRDAYKAWNIGQLEDWMLLLQVDSDWTPRNQPNHPEFLWSDSGVIYFCINKNDLLERNFERVWLDMKFY
jgi:uncharacterized protein YwqG